MKKMILTFFIILFYPYSIFAYSTSIIPGGESIGININTDGLIVVGYYKVNDKYIGKDNIKIGDRITKICNEEVNSINELSDKINDNIVDNSVDIELIRNGKLINTKLNLEEEDNLYKTGLYIKDNVVGLGTLTYIDPISKIYGSLGHEIVLNETNEKVDGYVGSKNASISYNNKVGNIVTNNENGLYGFYTSKLPIKNTMQIAEFKDIVLGYAYILTVTNDNEIKKYKIKIVDKYNNKKDTQKAFSFEIVDDELLSITGGIVQGMSGSPIIQNDKIIGCVTNVVIDNVKLGYGISIITMLEEGDKINN